MKKFFLFIFALISLQASSQTIWTKGHAVWHYRFNNVAETGYIKLWETGDTIVQGKQCINLKSERHSFMMTGPNGGYFESVTDYIGGTVYIANDTVYYWDQDHFSVLCDFSAQASDQWLLQTGGNPAFGCNDTSVCMVQSTGTTWINGQNYAELTLTSQTGSACYLSGKANARFGASQGYLLPFPTGCDSTIVEWDQVSFSCFEDDSLYYNPGGQACEIHLGLDESLKQGVSVFPNPSSGKIGLLSDVPLKQIRVVDVLGTLLKKQESNLTLNMVDLTGLPQGTYYLDLEDVNGLRIMKSVQLMNP